MSPDSRLLQGFHHRGDAYYLGQPRRGHVNGSLQGFPRPYGTAKFFVVIAGFPLLTIILPDQGLILQNGKRRKGIVPGGGSKGRNVDERLKQGAGLVSCAKDVLEFYNMTAASMEPTERQGMQGVEKKILEQLQKEPLEIDALARNLEMPAAQIGTTLSLMQINGFIEEDSGKYYVN